MDFGVGSQGNGCGRKGVGLLFGKYGGCEVIGDHMQGKNIGRWAKDVYFDGNPWYPTTLGFAEIDYRIAALTGDTKAFDRAEARMALVQDFAPDPVIPLPEQFDRASGAPTSCLELTWSAAACLEAAAARDQAMGASR